MPDLKGKQSKFKENIYLKFL